MVKKISDALHQKNTLTGASVILIITLFLSNVLGVVRDHFLTQKIPTDLLSTYYAAFRIPDFIFNILILGAIASAFIPVFTTIITQKKEKEAWQVTSSIINIAFIALIFLIVILFFIMPYLVPLVVPGFDSDRQLLTVKLARIMLGSPLIFSLSYIMGGVLNSYKRFLAYSLAPLVYNLTIILGTYFFADRFSVVGVAYAVLAGAFLHMLIQLPVVIKLGFKYQVKIFYQHWAVRRIGLLMFPRAIALGSNQIMLLIFTAIASSLGGASVAIYNLADNIQTMPMVVFGTSFATAIFPHLSESISANKKEEFAAQIEKMMRIIMFFLVPITVIVILLRTEIVRLILGSGFFGWQETIDTANTLGIFSLALVFSGLMPLFSRAYYAMHNTKIPMVIMITNVVISIILGKIFSPFYGVVGLAMGFAVGTAVSTIILYLLLRYKVKIFHEKDIVIFVLKIVLASFIMAIAIQEIKSLSGIVVDMQRFWGVLAKTLVSLGLGSAIYLLCCWIFGCQEIKAIKIFFAKFGNRGLDESDIK